MAKRKESSIIVSAAVIKSKILSRMKLVDFRLNKNRKPTEAVNAYFVLVELPEGMTIDERSIVETVDGVSTVVLRLTPSIIAQCTQNSYKNFEDLVDCEDVDPSDLLSTGELATLRAKLLEDFIQESDQTVRSLEAKIGANLKMDKANLDASINENKIMQDRLTLLDKENYEQREKIASLNNRIATLTAEQGELIKLNKKKSFFDRLFND